jgi:hypothetical protein
MYKIKLQGKRYNTKNFSSYEEARQYLRRLITKRTGSYKDAFGVFGFSITK